MSAMVVKIVITMVADDTIHESTITLLVCLQIKRTACHMYYIYDVLCGFICNLLLIFFVFT